MPRSYRAESKSRSAAKRVPLTLLPMEAHQVEKLPDSSGWQFEPKWDGFRCLAFRTGNKTHLRSKAGKDLTRFFPEVAASLSVLDPPQFVLDGELVIPVGKQLDFAALQARLHPAESRIQRLSRETPALFMAFDILDEGGGSLIEHPFSERRKALERFYSKAQGNDRLRLSPFSRTPSVAKRWLSQAGGSLDGIIVKRLDAPYSPGERAMLKVKCLRTADCVVGGYRYETGGKLIGSLLLGLFNERGQLDHVGFTSGIVERDRAAWTAKVENLRGGKGFTGRAPGGPSRWSTERSSAWEPVKPVLVVEVRYDHVTDNRFRHGTKFLRWRPDKLPNQCTLEQLKSESIFLTQHAL